MSINDPNEVRDMQVKQAADLLMEAKQEVPLGKYKHYKGKEVYVFALSLQEDTLDILVHYFEYEDHIWWTRTLENFQEKVTGGTGAVPYEGPRFTFLRHAMNSDLLFATGAL